MEALPAVEVPDLDAGVRRAGDDPVLGADDLALLLLPPHPLVVVDLVLALKERVVRSTGLSDCSLHRRHPLLVRGYFSHLLLDAGLTPSCSRGINP